MDHLESVEKPEQKEKFKKLLTVLDKNFEEHATGGKTLNDFKRFVQTTVKDLVDTSLDGRQDVVENWLENKTTEYTEHLQKELSTSKHTIETSGTSLINNISEKNNKTLENLLEKPFDERVSAIDQSLGEINSQLSNKKKEVTQHKINFQEKSELHQRFLGKESEIKLNPNLTIDLDKVASFHREQLSAVKKSLVAGNKQANILKEEHLKQKQSSHKDLNDRMNLFRSDPFLEELKDQHKATDVKDRTELNSKLIEELNGLKNHKGYPEGGIAATKEPSSLTALHTSLFEQSKDALLDPSLDVSNQAYKRLNEIRKDPYFREKSNKIFTAPEETKGELLEKFKGDLKKATQLENYPEKGFSETIQAEKKAAKEKAFSQHSDFNPKKAEKVRQVDDTINTKLESASSEQKQSKKEQYQKLQEAATSDKPNKIKQTFEKMRGLLNKTSKTKAASKERSI